MHEAARARIYERWCDQPMFLFALTILNHAEHDNYL